MKRARTTGENDAGTTDDEQNRNTAEHRNHSITTPTNTGSTTESSQRHCQTADGNHTKRHRRTAEQRRQTSHNNTRRTRSQQTMKAGEGTSARRCRDADTHNAHAELRRRHPHAPRRRRYSLAQADVDWAHNLLKNERGRA